MKIEIATKEGILYSEEVDFVTLPGSAGELGVLKDHTSLLTIIKPATITVKSKGKEVKFRVGSGIAEITKDKITVLTSRCSQV